MPPRYRKSGGGGCGALIAKCRCKTDVEIMVEESQASCGVDAIQRAWPGARLLEVYRQAPELLRINLLTAHSCAMCAAQLLAAPMSASCGLPPCALKAHNTYQVRDWTLA